MKYLQNMRMVEAFSDAVFAFAATLLLISVGYGESTSVIKIEWLAFLGFGVIFFVLVGLWWLHYNYFRRANYLDNWIIAINSILLFVVLYYIFPLKSLINSMTGTQRLQIDGVASLFQLYSLGFLLIFTCYSLMYYRAYEQTKSNQRNYDLLFYARHFEIYVLVSFASMILAKLKIWVEWALPGIIYMLLGPFYNLHGERFNKINETDIL